MSNGQFNNENIEDIIGEEWNNLAENASPNNKQPKNSLPEN
jgi:hypothetical protein